MKGTRQERRRWAIFDSNHCTAAKCIIAIRAGLDGLAGGRDPHHNVYIVGVHSCVLAHAAASAAKRPNRVSLVQVQVRLRTLAEHGEPSDSDSAALGVV